MTTYTIKRINNKMSLCKMSHAGMRGYITLNRLKEVDDKLHDKVYNNSSYNNYIPKKFKHECFIFFKQHKGDINGRAETGNKRTTFGKGKCKRKRIV